MFVINEPRVLIKLLLFVSLLILHPELMNAQKKWDGGGGDNQWTTAANWTDDIIPVSTDDVLLDNMIFSGSFMVQLPNSAVTINSLTITPALTDSIKLLLPITNTVIPAFTVTGAGGIVINNRGIFINSSGGSPGAALVVIDSVKIYDGGRFIHKTSNSHASFVSRLSRAPGTEKGIFEFNVPGAASYTISLSGRTYGAFELSATAAGGNKSYLSNGITTANIRGDCSIRAGVNYTLDFTGDLMVFGSLYINGNFNLAAAPNNNNIKVRQHLFCSGNITESSTGFPVIELNGNTNQDISIPGNILNSVILKLNNPSGATLLSAVSLPYKLDLVKGKLTTTPSLLLSLQPNCSIQADSTNNNCFVNGPLQKLGLSNSSFFLFPVGKGVLQRWAEVKNATGNFTVEFYKSSAYSLSTSMGSGIDHVSHIEYWSIDANSGASANIELSFDNVNSGGVTDINSLRVAHLSGGSWLNSGNISTTGSAGAAGSVISNTENNFDASSNYFTLAGSDPNQNPLPVQWVKLTAMRTTTCIQLMWQINGNTAASAIEIERSTDGHTFQTIKRLSGYETSFMDTYHTNNPSTIIHYYRIRVVGLAGNNFYSKVVAFHFSPEKVYLTGIKTSGLPGNYSLILAAPKKMPLTLCIVNINGQLVKKIPLQLKPGNQEISLTLQSLGPGYFQVFGVSSTLLTNPLKFFKF